MIKVQTFSFYFVKFHLESLVTKSQMKNLKAIIQNQRRETPLRLWYFVQFSKIDPIWHSLRRVNFDFGEPNGEQIENLMNVLKSVTQLQPRYFNRYFVRFSNVNPSCYNWQNQFWRKHAIPCFRKSRLFSIFQKFRCVLALEPNILQVKCRCTKLIVLFGKMIVILVVGWYSHSGI